MLPTNSQERKERPIASGFLDYFPDAIAEVSHVSFVGNEKHNPGQPLHWSRGKSNDHVDCAARHLIEHGKMDEDGLRHTAKLAWRALALLQIELEGEADGSLDVHTDIIAEKSRVAYASASYRRTIYLSGPMRGVKDFNFPAFDAAARKWRAAGWEVINPADMDRSDKGEPKSQIDYAQRDTEALIRIAKTGTGAIYVLNGWENSTGATAEHYLANWLGLEIIYAV